MEVPPAAPAVARNGGFSMPPISSSSSQPSRKEWRVVSEQSVRNSGSEVDIYLALLYFVYEIFSLVYVFSKIMLKRLV